ncbi:MAG TPA: hypothetical protein PKJ45_02710 [Rubrivivax sp.]|nr:hypothetical protein [Rubrivivax sp.]
MLQMSMHGRTDAEATERSESHAVLDDDPETKTGNRAKTPVNIRRRTLGALGVQVRCYVVDFARA